MLLRKIYSTETREYVFNKYTNEDERNKYRVCYYCGRSYPKVKLNYYRQLNEGGVLKCCDEYKGMCNKIYNWDQNRAIFQKKKKELEIQRLNEKIRKREEKGKKKKKKTKYDFSSGLMLIH